VGLANSIFKDHARRALPASLLFKKTAVYSFIWEIASLEITQEESTLTISSPVLSKTAVYRWV
jgi:hypothetical protein